jgi:hypothetical protein
VRAVEKLSAGKSSRTHTPSICKGRMRIAPLQQHESAVHHHILSLAGLIRRTWNVVPTFQDRRPRMLQRRRSFPRRDYTKLSTVGSKPDAHKAPCSWYGGLKAAKQSVPHALVSSHTAALKSALSEVTVPASRELLPAPESRSSRSVCGESTHDAAQVYQRHAQRVSLGRAQPFRQHRQIRT